MRHTCITFFAKSKTGSKERIKSYIQIKMCICRDMIAMVRWILDPEWVLDITTCIMNVFFCEMYNECYDDGKVYTRPGMGASYYH
jgi:hypothetical protein